MSSNHVDKGAAGGADGSSKHVSEGVAGINRGQQNMLTRESLEVNRCQKCEAQWKLAARASEIRKKIDRITPHAVFN